MDSWREGSVDGEPYPPPPLSSAVGTDDQLKTRFQLVHVYMNQESCKTGKTREKGFEEMIYLLNTEQEQQSVPHTL